MGNFNNNDSKMEKQVVQNAIAHQLLSSHPAPSAYSLTGRASDMGKKLLDLE